MASPKPRVEIPLSHSCWNGNIPTMRTRLLATLGFAIACFVGAVRAADTAAHAPTTEHIKAAIVKSLPLLTTAARGSMEKREREGRAANVLQSDRARILCGGRPVRTGRRPTPSQDP